MKRVAIAGLGAASRSIHIPALRRIPELRLCGGTDPAAAAREEFSRAAGAPAHADLGALLGRERPDWLVVAAPPDHHRQLCIQGLEAGAHVFCEKPFGASLEDVDAILEAAKRAGRQVAVNLEYPRMPIFAALLRETATPEFGRPLLIQAWQHVDQDPRHEAGWRQEGRTLREFGCHAIDLVMRIHGAPPWRVYARMPQPLGRAESDAIDLLVLDFADERAAVLTLDRVCRGRHRYLEMRVDGQGSSLRASIGGRAGLSLFLDARSRRPRLRLEVAGGGRAWREVGERRRTLARNPVNAFAAATAEHLAAVMAAVDAGREPPASGREARAVMEVVAAAYRSAERGSPVLIGGDTRP